MDEALQRAFDTLGPEAKNCVTFFKERLDQLGDVAVKSAEAFGGQEGVEFATVERLTGLLVTFLHASYTSLTVTAEAVLGVARETDRDLANTIMSEYRESFCQLVGG